MVRVTLPQMGESVSQATITRWLKGEGDRVERDEPLYEISTDKVDTEVPSPASGVLRKIRVKGGGEAKVGETVAEIGEEDGDKRERGRERREGREGGGGDRGEDRGKEEHGERREEGREHAEEKKRGGGEDRGEEEERAGAEGERREESTPQWPARAVRDDGVEAIPMSPMREKIAEHMVRSRRTSAHVTTVFEADMTGIADLRERSKEAFEKAHGVKLSFLPFVARAAIAAIHAFPMLNSSVDGNRILRKRRVNLGIAVAVPDGLIVPVIHRAEELSFLGLTRAIHEMADRARRRKLAVEDVQGGTFTISNYGVFGGLFATPIINQPQVAILGVGTIQERPVANRGAIAVRSMVYLSLSYDHRVIDGAMAEQFLGHLKGSLEGWKEPIS